MKKIVTKTEKETFNFAKKFAKELKGGDVIGLIGNLGAGKTIFSKGVAAGLGIEEELTSPTFVYMKVYNVKNHPSIKKMCHIDAYRAEDQQIIINIGALEYFSNPQVITVVEWVDKIEKLKKSDWINIEIKQRNKERLIII